MSSRVPAVRETQMVTASPPAPPDGDGRPPEPEGPGRAAADLLIGALAGSTLLPFVHAIAAKAGEDVYQLIRGRLSRQGRKRARAELRDTGVVTLADQDTRVLLRVPRTCDPLMAARLDRVRLPGQRDGWVLVRWDPARSLWLAEPCPEPPPVVTVLD